jgi:hypothetical protein
VAVKVRRSPAILHRLVGLSLVAAALTLAPAAYASPPDQSWTPGLYDNADFDDVVLLITSKQRGPWPFEVDFENNGDNAGRGTRQTA